MPQNGAFLCVRIFMRLYLMLAAIAAVFMFCVYYAGLSNGQQKCQKNVAQNNVQQQMDLIYLKEQINAEVITADTDDIRRRLYEKYTIAD